MTATLARTARNFRTKSFTYNTLYCSENWQIYNMGYCVTCYNRQQSSASLNLQSITIKKPKVGWPDSCSLLPQQSKQGHRRWALQRGGWRRHCKKVNFHDWKADKKPQLSTMQNVIKKGANFNFFILPKNHFFLQINNFATISRLCLQIIYTIISSQQLETDFFN